MYTLTLNHKFDAAHKLESYKGPCANIHGHTWRVKIKIVTAKLIDDMIIDFKVLKTEIDEKFDHQYINAKVDYNPTAENIAKDIHDTVHNLLYTQHNKVKYGEKVEITVWESENASITYSA